jgi:hypothetical protein
MGAGMQDYPRKQTTFWVHGQWLCEFWLTDEMGRGRVTVSHRGRVRGVMDCDSETDGAVVAKRWKDSLDDGSHKFK